MKKLLYILLSFISIQATAQIEQPRIKFNQVIKDSTGSGRIVISSLTDSNMIYSTDFYINPTDSLLIFFGDTIVGGGSTLSSVLVDSIFIYGDGSTTPIQLNIANTRDSILTRIAPGLGIDTTYVNGLLTISSLNIEEVCKNETSRTLLKGYPVYQVACNNQGNAICVDYADASNSLKMPAVGILEDNLAPGQEGKILFTGFIQGVNTSMFASGDVIYVAVDSGYTNVKPKGENVLIQNIGRVIKVHDNNGSGIIIGAGRSNDVPNLNPNNIFIGGVDSVVTSISLPTVISDSLNNYLALSDYIVDSTRLTQDSILVYYQNGTIIRQDTISGIGSSAGGGLNVYQQTFTVTTDSSFTLSNAPLSKEYVIVAENGLVIDNDLFSVTGTSLDLTYMPQEGQLTAIWFEGSGGSGGGLSSVSVDSLTIYGDGLTTPLYVDTTFMTTKRYVDSVATTLGGGAMFQQIFIADGTTNQFTVTENSGNLPATDKDLLVAENGQILDKDLITLDQGNNLVILDSIPEAGSRIAVIWFDAIAINGGLDSVFTDNTITGNGLTGSPLRVDTSIIATTTALNDSLAGFQSFTNISETANTVYIDSFLNVANGTLYVDANSNRIGINKIPQDSTFKGGLQIDNTPYSAVNEPGIRLYGDYTTMWMLNNNISNGYSQLFFGESLSKYAELLWDNNTDKYQTFVLGGDILFSTQYVYPNILPNLWIDGDNGNVGIGTDSPNAKLDVRDGTINITNSGTQKLTISQEGVNTNDGFFSIGNATSGTTIFRPIFYAKGNSSDAFYNSGFVFDATDDSAADGPLAIFDARQNNTTVSNRDLFHFANGFSTIVMAIEADGDATLAGSLTQNSDIRLKTNINQIKYGLNDILQLNPVEYRFIDYPKENRLGFIAQEVEPIIPEAIRGIESEDSYLSIAYSYFTPILTKAIQEQQFIIESQATKIQNLESTIQTQQQQIQDLINRITAIENQ